MSAALRLAVVGGSGASSPELVDALADWPGGRERRPALEVVLQGRNAEKLALVADACRSRLAASVDDVVIRPETSLETALEGADGVLIQVRVGGLDARIFDETFPRSFGIPGEETMGPGGFTNAVRTVPALAPLWDTLAARAAGAFIVNLTNPSGIVSQAAIAHTGLRIVSVCDGPVTFVRGIANATGRPEEQVRQGYAGLNHAGFWADPDTDAMLASLGATSGIDEKDVLRLGALPTPYLRYYLHPDRQLESQLAAPESRAQSLKRLETEMLGQYSAHVEAGRQVRRGALWYGVSIVPLIDAFANGGNETFVLGLPNRGAVGWVPEDATVELATEVRAGGEMKRQGAPTLPAPAVELLTPHARFETATARALAGARSRADVRTRRAQLVEALAANPLVPSEQVAASIVDHVLEASPE